MKQLNIFSNSSRLGPGDNTISSFISSELWKYNHRFWSFWTILLLGYFTYSLHTVFIWCRISIETLFSVRWFDIKIRGKLVVACAKKEPIKCWSRSVSQSGHSFLSRSANGLARGLSSANASPVIAVKMISTVSPSPSCAVIHDLRWQLIVIMWKRVVLNVWSQPWMVHDGSTDMLAVNGLLLSYKHSLADTLEMSVQMLLICSQLQAEKHWGKIHFKFSRIRQ